MGEPALDIIMRSGFKPTQLPALQLWLAGDRSAAYQDAARTTLAAADGDPAGNLTDLSGNGRNATQATAGKRPILKLGLQNGLPGWRFDGVDDFLTHGFTVPINTAVTAISVLKRLDSSLADRDVLTAGRYLQAFRSSSLNWGIYMGVSLISSYQLDTFKVISTVIRATNDVDLVTNGVVETKTTGTGNPYGGSTAACIGAIDGTSGQYSNVDLLEVLICSGALSTTWRSRAERYLGAKYGLAVA